MSYYHIVITAFLGFTAIIILWIATNLSDIARTLRLQQYDMQKLNTMISNFVIKYKR